MNTRRACRTAVTDPTVAVGYLRVSTEDQALGPEAQKAAIERWAHGQGARVVAWHSDIGVSGATPVEDRPGFLAAIDALGLHAAGLLVVAKRDRLARDVLVAAIASRLVERTGATIVSSDSAGNGTGPEAALMRSVIDAFGAYERALIRARTKSALAVKRARGERTSGYAPLGYGFEGGRLVPMPEEQAVVERVREMHAAGASLNAIARRLNAEGAPSRGHRWYANSVRCIVRASVAA